MRNSIKSLSAWGHYSVEMVLPRDKMELRRADGLSPNRGSSSGWVAIQLPFRGLRDWVGVGDFLGHPGKKKGSAQL